MRDLPPALIAALILLTETLPSHALQLQVQARRRPSLQRRDNSVALVDSGDVSYQTNLTLGGVSFACLVDTGSSDLWVAGSVPGASLTGFTTGVNYAVGQVQGPIKLATLDFAGFTVQSQAYLEVTPDTDNPQGTGLIGLGPNSGSSIFQTVSTPASATVLDRIFLQNTTTPNFITVLLGRKQDPSDTYSGTITVGEVLSDFNAVTNQPKLLVTDVPIRDAGDQHFQILLDDDGLIGPDGNVIQLQTVVAGTQDKKQTTAVVDTGFSLPQLPKVAADAIYSQIPGAEFTTLNNIGGVWIVPCQKEVNITFKFGGIKYPIHPLDTTLDPQLVGLSKVRNSAGDPCCIGTFQPFSFDTGTTPEYDMILGMAFLRNVYMLVDYGDFVVGSTQLDDPYIQFLSTTDPVEAHSDFVKVRLNGVDTTSSQGHNAGTGSGSGASPNSNGNDPGGSKSKMAVIAIVAGVVAIAFGGLSGLIWLFRTRRVRNASKHQRLSGGNYTGFGMAMVSASGGGGGGAGGRGGGQAYYHSLQHPAPPAAGAQPPQTVLVPGTNAQGYVAGYTSGGGGGGSGGYTGYTGGGYSTPPLGPPVNRDSYLGGGAGGGYGGGGYGGGYSGEGPGTNSESHYMSSGMSSGHGWTTGPSMSTR
ncbi:acid protease [Pluteus cervinus]|uniref:Acid protease n=1 Tax=Pluteus cervinus TaxID=181527 RepID=A0ACD3B032_9AGAR|nr:acid protease [Pluteus cervinus]